MPDPDPLSDPPCGGGPPAPLVVAASLVAVEGACLVLYGVAELLAVDAARIVMGVTTALFFLAYGAALGCAAWALWRLASWARAPVVLSQLIQLGVAWSFRGEGTVLIAGVLAVSAVLVLAGVFHPASVRAVEGPRAAD